MWGYGDGGMMGWSGLGGMWMLWWLVVVGLGSLVFAVVRLASRSRDGGHNPSEVSTSSARAILDDRYARGEIDTEEHTERAKHLEGK